MEQVDRVLAEHSPSFDVPPLEQSANEGMGGSDSILLPLYNVNDLDEDVFDFLK